MTKTILHFAIMFVILVLAQAVVFNHICLFGVALPLVFIYFIIKLPIDLGANMMLTAGFLLGLTVDIFSDTQGMNALACTILSAMRRPVMHLYLPREDDMTDPVPSAKSMGDSVYAKYSFSMVLLYSIVFFLVESMTFFNFWRLILKISASAILTFIIITAIDSLTSRRREKRL